MQRRRTLRIPSFVAEKSQYRNCQRQERVAFSHRCADGGEAEISTLASRTIELARRRRKLFKTNLFESNDPAAADKYRGGAGAMTRGRNNVAGAGNSPTMSRCEAVRLYARALLPGRPTSARLRQFF
jgi:hypothetical protein